MVLIYAKFNILPNIFSISSYKWSGRSVSQIWCNNTKESLFLCATFLDLAFYFFTKNECFLCALCGIVTAFFLLFPNYTMQKHFWNKQSCPKLINVIIKKIPSQRSGAKHTFAKRCDERIYVLVTHCYLNFSFLLRHDVMSIHNFNIFIRIF